MVEATRPGVVESAVRLDAHRPRHAANRAVKPQHFPATLSAACGVRLTEGCPWGLIRLPPRSARFMLAAGMEALSDGALVIVTQNLQLALD